MRRARGAHLPVSVAIPLSFSCHVCWREQKKEKIMSERGVDPCLVSAILTLQLSMFSLDQDQDGPSVPLEEGRRSPATGHPLT